MNITSSYVFLSNYSEEAQKFLLQRIIMSLNEKSIFYITRIRDGKLFPLHKGQLEEIRANTFDYIPARGTAIYFELPSDSNPIGDFQTTRLNGLLVDRLTADTLLVHMQKKSNKRSENTDLNIIAALFKTLLATTPAGQKLSSFTSQAALISYLETNFGHLDGISKRNLEKKFGKVKEIIPEK